MITPAASFLMPVYNAEAYVAKAIESALAQTVQDIEIVAVDDGSTDSSRDILLRYAAQDSRLRVFEEPHRGLIATLNRGLAAARGKYICRLDADDITMLDRVQRQVDFLDKNPDYVLVGGQATVIGPNGETIRELQLHLSHEAIYKELQTSPCIVHSAVMFRRDEVRNAGGYDPLFLHAEDYDLWIRLAATYRLANLRDPVCKYRVHGSQVSCSRILRQTFTILCLQAAFRGASRETIIETVQTEEDDFIPALRRLGYSDDEVAAGLNANYLSWVAWLKSAGNREAAYRLLSQIQGHLRGMKCSSRYLAQAYSWEFLINVGAHNFPRAARSLFLAFAHAPGKTARNILTRLVTSRASLRNHSQAEP